VRLDLEPEEDRRPRCRNDHLLPAPVRFPEIGLVRFRCSVCDWQLQLREDEVKLNA
jgi:hypothetical protein